MKLTANDLEKYKKKLLAKREELTGINTQMESHALKATEQDSSVDHMADFGSDNFEQFVSLGLLENNEKLVQQIDEALERIDEGTYGVCRHCKKPISKARLNVVPWTAYCVDCQRLIEERGFEEEEEPGREEDEA